MYAKKIWNEDGDWTRRKKIKGTRLDSVLGFLADFALDLEEKNSCG
jgi:hypothetical protein